MRKLFICFFSMAILLSVLPGCGGVGPGGSDSKVSINVFDKTTGEPLSGVQLSILETNQSINLSNPYQVTLTKGLYTMYFSKSGYLTRGYVFNLASDLTLNVYLKQNNIIVETEDVSGKVLENGDDYTGAFYIYAGNHLTASYTEDIIHPQGLFTVRPVCGDIAVSAYTKTGDSINKIAYQKTTLNQGDPINNLSLELPNIPINYSGSKPAGDLLVVKQNEGYTLARQISNETFYSFGVALLSGDSVSLESSKTVNDTSYFTKVNAGNLGGTVNIQYQTAVSDFSIMSNGSNYVINFDAIGSSYYEAYAIQVTGSDGIVPFQTTGLSGTSIKVPKNIFDTAADATFIYLRLVNLSGYNLNNVLNATQNYQTYSYNEKTQSFTPGSSSSSKNQISSFNRIIIETKTRLSLNYLCSE